MEGGIIDSGSVIVASSTPMWVWVMAVSTMLGLGDTGMCRCGRQTTLGLGECRRRLRAKCWGWQTRRVSTSWLSSLVVVGSSPLSRWLPAMLMQVVDVERCPSSVRDDAGMGGYDPSSVRDNVGVGVVVVHSRPLETT